MKVLRKVQVKQVITKESKQLMITTYNQKKTQLEKEISQLEFQLHKKLKTSKNDYEHQNSLKLSFMKEIKDRNDKVKMIRFQIQQLNELELGSEVYDHSINSICELSVGDNLNSVMNDAEIIIRDGIIQEIREGGKNDD